FTDEEVKKFNAEWRAAHPAIKRFWYNIDRAALTAVRERGRVIRCGPIAFKSSFRRRNASDNAAGQFCDCRNGQGEMGELVRAAEAFRHLGNDLAVRVQHDGIAAGFNTQHGFSEQIASDAADDVLGP